MDNKILEVRLFARDRNPGCTDLYFIDRSGEERIVAHGAAILGRETGAAHDHTD